MVLKDKLNNLIAEAIKAKENYKVKVLRLIKSEYQKFETSGNGKSLDDTEEIKILKKLQKQWKEELEAFIEAGRETFDLTLELKYLESFIPAELSEEEQKTVIQEVVERYLNGLPIEERRTMKHLGAIIKILNGMHPLISNKLISEYYRKAVGL